jgi:hypothetical protein
MDKHVEIEDIEAMRRRVGIDDVELREALRGLRIGDHVKLTFLTGKAPSAGETLLVQITRIRGGAFRGKLVERPASVGLSGVRLRSEITFTTAHIHSLPEGRLTHAR